MQILPTGVSTPSFSLKTISVWPSIRNLGGLFPLTDATLNNNTAKRQFQLGKHRLLLNLIFMKYPQNVLKTFLNCMRRLFMPVVTVMRM